MSHRLIVAIVLAALLSLVGANAVLGCDDYSPGYWKNHTDEWPCGISSDADFDTAVEKEWFDPDITLMQALQQGGGGDKKAGRYMVADLLNDAL